MKEYEITGMSCASCQAHVTKAVEQVAGVTSVNVSLLSNSMQVEGNADEKAVIAAVKDAGYGASLKGKQQSQQDPYEDRETPELLKRLKYSIGFLTVLMYFSMGHMLSLPVPSFLEHNPVGNGIIQMTLAMIVLMINRKFFVSGWKALRHGSSNMDTLVALGSGISFIYSFLVLLQMSGMEHEGAMAAVHSLYFETAAMIPSLITVGKTMESLSKGKTTSALRQLISLAPKTAVVLRDGQEVTVDADQLQVNDLFVVRAGESVAADGVIVQGSAGFDESSLTGESVPVDKQAGDTVMATSINTSGHVVVKAQKVGKDTGFSRIIELVAQASDSKAPIARIADRVSGIFVPSIILIATVVLAGWLIAGAPLENALTHAVTVLVVACPCALGLATPTAIMVGNGVAAKHGILFKNAEALENAGRMEICVMDKTGTITQGVMHVTDITAVSQKKELLTYAVSLEKKSSHPVGQAVAQYGQENGVSVMDGTDVTVENGRGIHARMDGHLIRGGNLSWIGELCRIDSDVKADIEEKSSQGKTPLLFMKDDALLGVIYVADVIREDSASAIERLKRMGIVTVMCSGDRKATAEAIGRQAGVDHVIAEMLPEDKQQVIDALGSQGVTAMVGDGINDAPSLVSAQIGIAIGAGTDVAIDSADIVLMNSRLSDIPALVHLSRKVLRNIHENLFWAFAYNALLIPVAAGVVAGIHMNPMFGAAAMSLSSFTVCMNALRLNRCRLYEEKKDMIRKQKSVDFSDIRRKHTMKKTVKIEGMMCGHCEMSVRKALEAIDGIEQAVVSAQKGTAECTMSKDVNADVIRKAIEDRDFTFVSID